MLLTMIVHFAQRWRALRGDDCSIRALQDRVIMVLQLDNQDDKDVDTAVAIQVQLTTPGNLMTYNIEVLQAEILSR